MYIDSCKVRVTGILISFTFKPQEICFAEKSSSRHYTPFRSFGMTALIGRGIWQVPCKGI